MEAREAGEVSVLDIVLAQVKRHEGWRAHPYNDKTGKRVIAPDGGCITVGYGTNIETISKEEGEWLLEKRLAVAMTDAAMIFAQGWNALSDVRKAVLINMSYQLGGPRLSDFMNLRAAVATGDHAAAKLAMLDSVWARQVPSRALELAEAYFGDAARMV